QDNKQLEERLDSHGACLYTLENLDIPQQVSKAMDEIVTDTVDWAIQAPLQNRLRDLPEADMKEILHQRTTPDTRLRSSVSSTLEDLQMEDDMAPDAQVHSSDDEDIRNAHILKASAFAFIYSPPPKDSLLAQTGDMAIFMDWVADLSILKMKAAYYLDVGLEQMVPDQMWIEEECKYDIAAIAVRTHMRILSVVIIEVFSMYGYDYMKKILLRRADLNEHIIAE
nr:hypothetical protein [Tanacetum cinerariifolium]